MLTIKNIFKIRNKTLDKKNFYVFEIYEYPKQYRFQITNNVSIFQIDLKRTPMPNGYYEMECQSTNRAVTMNRAQIENLDVFLDKIRFVGIN